MPTKQSTFDMENLDEMFSDSMDSATLGEAALHGSSTIQAASKRATKGAAAGCKPGSTRHTYVMPIELINKIKAISGKFGVSEVSIVLDSLNKTVAEYEAKYGSEVSKLYSK